MGGGVTIENSGGNASCSFSGTTAMISSFGGNGPSRDENLMVPPNVDTNAKNIVPLP